MPDRSPIYTRYSDNILRGSTASVASGTPVAAPYTVAAGIDDNPATLVKFTSTGCAVDHDCGSAKVGAIAALIHHNLAAGTSCVLTAGATQGASTFTASFTIPPWIGGTGAQRWPVNPWLDLTVLANYGSYRWWRLTITGNDQNVQYGELVIGKALRRMTDLQLNPPPATGDSMKTIVNTSYFDVKTKTPLNNPVWRRAGEHIMSPALAADMREHWYDAAGQALPWLFIPDGTVNDARLVTWADDARVVTDMEHGNPSSHFSVEEVARGLRPGT